MLVFDVSQGGSFRPGQRPCAMSPNPDAEVLLRWREQHQGSCSICAVHPARSSHRISLYIINTAYDTWAYAYASHALPTLSQARSLSHWHTADLNSIHEHPQPKPHPPNRTHLARSIPTRHQPIRFRCLVGLSIAPRQNGGIAGVRPYCPRDGAVVAGVRGGGFGC